MDIRRSFLILLIFTILLGVIYTGIITIFAQIFFQKSANGDLIKENGTILGSYKIGQNFKENRHFWGRPSFTNYTFSSGSNYAYNSLKLKNKRDEIENFLKETSENNLSIPEDLLTYSASGLEAYISKEAAYYQIDRIVKNTNISKSKIEEIINNNLEKSYEQEIVNVLKLNIALDELYVN